MFEQRLFEQKLAVLFQSECPNEGFVNALENQLMEQARASTAVLKEPVDSEKSVKVWKSVAIGAGVLLLLLSFVMGPKKIWASLLDWFGVYLPKIGFSRVTSEKGLMLAEKTVFVENDVRFVFEPFYATSEATYFDLYFYDLPVYLNGTGEGDVLLNYDYVDLLDVQLSWEKEGELRTISCVPQSAGIIVNKENFDAKAAYQNWHIQFECAAIDAGVQKIIFEMQQLPLLLMGKGPETNRFDLEVKKVDLTDLDAVELLDFEILDN